MKKEFLSNYLYLSWNNKGGDEKIYREFLSYMTVAKTMIKDEISEEFEMLGDSAFIFSSSFDFDSVKEKLKHKRFPYILIDVSLNLSNNLISTYLQKEEVDKVEEFIESSKLNNLVYVKQKLEDAVSLEDYEQAVFFRDYLKKIELNISL